MKLLVLGNSAFLPRKGIAESDLPQNRPDAERDASVGGLDIVVKIAWPTEKLPGLADRWLKETEPDAVLFIVNEFWFNYRSVPALVSRKFGPLGPPIAKVGGWAGRNPRFAYSRVFQRFRRLAEDKVGADAHFEPDDVVQVSLDVLRRITRAEGPVPLVIGPLGGFDHLLPERLRAEGVRRRMVVDAALKRFCDANHIEFWGLDSAVALKRPNKPRSKLADGIHSDAAGVTSMLEYWGPNINAFLKRVHDEAVENGPKRAEPGGAGTPGRTRDL